MNARVIFSFLPSSGYARYSRERDGAAPKVSHSVQPVVAVVQGAPKAETERRRTAYKRIIKSNADGKASQKSKVKSQKSKVHRAQAFGTATLPCRGHTDDRAHFAGRNTFDF